MSAEFVFKRLVFVSEGLVCADAVCDCGIGDKWVGRAE